MTLTKLKIYGASALLALIPKGAYLASSFYVKQYENASSYISEVTTDALYSLGLEKVKHSEPETIHSLVIKYSNEYEINDALIRAVMKQESSGNSDSYSIAGAIGLMQIMPENAKRCGLEKVSKLWDDENNIRCGIQILREEIDFFKGDVHKALQSYNGGTSKVDKVEAVKKYANEVIAKYVQISAAS